MRILNAGHRKDVQQLITYCSNHGFLFSDLFIFMSIGTCCFGLLLRRNEPKNSAGVDQWCRGNFSLKGF